MNKKEILNELLQENPEISKENMEKIFEIFLQNNPKVEIDKNFRKNLKTRLENIGNLEKKSFLPSFFRIFVPIFCSISIFFVFSFFYFDLEKNDETFNRFLPLQEGQKGNSVGNEYINFDEKIPHPNPFLKEMEQNVDSVGNDFKSFQKDENSEIKNLKNQEIDEDFILPVKMQNFNLEKNDETFNQFLPLQEGQGRNSVGNEYINSDEKIPYPSSFLKEKEQNVDSVGNDLKSFQRDENIFQKKCEGNGFEFFVEKGEKICKIGENKICKQTDFEKEKCEFLK